MGFSIALGVDCGFAHTGLAIVQGPIAAPSLLYGGCVTTTPKGHTARRSQGDTQRLAKIAQALTGALAAHPRIAVAGVEYYAPYPGRTGGAWKVAMCYGVVLGLCTGRGIGVYCQLPIDVKLAVLGVKSASKNEIQERIEQAMPSLTPMLLAIPKARREHVADAAGHALLALRSYKAGQAPHL